MIPSSGYCVHEGSQWALRVQPSAWCEASSDKVVVMATNAICIITPSTELGEAKAHLVVDRSTLYPLLGPWPGQLSMTDSLALQKLSGL